MTPVCTHKVQLLGLRTSNSTARVKEQRISLLLCKYKIERRGKSGNPERCAIRTYANVRSCSAVITSPWGIIVIGPYSCHFTLCQVVPWAWARLTSVNIRRMPHKAWVGKRSTLSPWAQWSRTCRCWSERPRCPVTALYDGEAVTVQFRVSAAIASASQCLLRMKCKSVDSCGKGTAPASAVSVRCKKLTAAK